MLNYQILNSRGFALKSKDQLSFFSSTSFSERSLISLCNAGVKQNGRWLVRHINMDIFPGELITLIGPNGSGKSTTAKMALNILEPTEGTVKRRSGLKVGYIPQKLNFSRAMPLNIARLMELTGSLDRDVIDTALKKVGMWHMRNAEVSTLSGGELQRVLFARASARKPDLLVLDEPLHGIDFAGKNTLCQLINDYRNRFNCGIILISHDLHIVMATSDRVLCLNGYVCCSGKPQEVAGSKEYAALFGGEQGSSNLALCKEMSDH